MKIWYQSFGDYENASAFWDTLRPYLDGVSQVDTEFHIEGITPFDSYAHPFVEFRCAREMIVNAIRAEPEGYDAFIVGHFQDSGLYEARAAVNIPVISLGEATMLWACQMGQRIGTVTINPRFIPGHLHQIEKYGLSKRVTDVQAMTFEPGQMLAAFGDPANTDAVRTEFDRQAAPMIEAGVNVLIPGEGLPMLQFSQTDKHNVGRAPVLSGIPIIVKMAEMAAELKRLTGQ
jgi:Asp/Glu/hydantoin racemase